MRWLTYIPISLLSIAALCAVIYDIYVFIQGATQWEDRHRNSWIGIAFTTAIYLGNIFLFVYVFAKALDPIMYQFGGDRYSNAGAGIGLFAGGGFCYCIKHRARLIEENRRLRSIVHEVAELAGKFKDKEKLPYWMIEAKRIVSNDQGDN